MPRVVAMSKTDLFKNSLARTKGRISRNKLIEELNKVRESGVHMWLFDYDLNDQKVCLLSSFLWNQTPQGKQFWSGLYFGY